MIDIKVCLTKDQRQRLIKGEEVTISISPSKQSRTERTKEDIALVALPKTIVQLVHAWNDSDYIKGATDESRNNPITKQQVEDQAPNFKRAIAELGEKSIIVAMNKYFDACSLGRHLWGSPGGGPIKNHGYSHLGGFVRKLLDCKASGKKPYWATKIAKMADDHPALTKKVANAYAKKFLGRSSYGLTNPSTVYEAFCVAADWVEIKSKKMPFSQERLIEYLLNCVEQICREKNRTPSPNWLSSEKTWGNDIPIYLKKILG